MQMLHFPENDSDKKVNVKESLQQLVDSGYLTISPAPFLSAQTTQSQQTTPASTST